MQHYSHGKLLLSAEYAVLDGAKALALPCKYGQDLNIKKIQEESIIWESFSKDRQLWIRVEFDLPKLRIINATFNSKSDGGNDQLAEKLQEILKNIQQIKPEKFHHGNHFVTNLDFPRNWGLGTSSTLINNLAQWSGIDPYNLQFKSFGGSGYDIACAQANGPILYSITDKVPSIETIEFNPDFKDQLYFVHLNKKQNSREGIKQYQNYKGSIPNLISEISELTLEMSVAKDLLLFENILKSHENLISKIIALEPVQYRFFPDYFGQTKSLGAWGGDFILATGNNESPAYFKSKGFETVLKYEDMIL